MKTKIIELLLSTERKGIENLIQHMEDNGFFTAPCSSQFHLCKEGGLAEHSLNVRNKMWDVAICMDYTAPFRNIDEVKSDKDISIDIVSLLHDLGKMGQFGKPQYSENYLVSGKRSDKKPFETNKNLLPVPHEIRSIQIASQFIELTEEENFAILYHNALYSDLKYAYSGHETALSLLLHFSDLWNSRVVESKNE